MRGQCLKALKPKKAMKAIGFGKPKRKENAKGNKSQQVSEKGQSPRVAG